MNETLERRFLEIEQLAGEMGLDFFPVVFEEVPRDVIWEIASYGLPTRMSHWSFGRTWLHQKTYGEMGFSKIYELIVNNNPSYAFLDDTNTDVINLLIAAHCLGHSSFFKCNQLFASTNRNMVNQAEKNAKTIDSYKTKYGIDAVEDIMDIGFAIDRHIDPVAGENRKRYPEMTHSFREVQPLPYADLFGEDVKPRIIEEIKNEKLPPRPEKDLIWFLTTYAKMLPWQREVLTIVRSESYYFYPQGQTKIMNEGWASYWHAELMYNYKNISSAEFVDFSKAHAGVVSPGHGGRLNPYYVGFRIYKDIKKRWDEAFEAGKKDVAFIASDATDVFDKNGKLVMSKVSGQEKIFKVMMEDDDFSFITNYLTRELCEDMMLFTYGLAGNVPEDADPEDDDLIILDRDLHKVRDAMTKGLHNNGCPQIVITNVEDNTLYMEHDKNDRLPLDENYARKTIEYMYKVWKGPISLKTKDRFGNAKNITVGLHGARPDGAKHTEKFRFEM